MKIFMGKKTRNPNIHHEVIESQESDFREFLDEKQVPEVQISPLVLNHRDILRSGSISWCEMTHAGVEVEP